MVGGVDLLLTTKQKKYLRSIAQKIKPAVQVGKNGVTDGTLKSMEQSLKAHELVKVTVLQNNDSDRHELAEMLSRESGSELVQEIGRQLIFYKRNDDRPVIKLPAL